MEVTGLGNETSIAACPVLGSSPATYNPGSVESDGKKIMRFVPIIVASLELKFQCSVYVKRNGIIKLP